MLIIGPVQDTIFGLVILLNMMVGIVQELRVKRALDRLAVLTDAPARVRRGNEVVELPVAEVAVGELLEVHAGDQVAVDGEVMEARGLEANEALVTGEAQQIAKTIGAPLLSGSFIAAGSGTYRTTHTAADSYAARLSAEAKEFHPATSELRAGTDRMLAMIAVLVVPVGALLVRSQLIASGRTTDAIRSSVAGLVTMVPEGLVLLTSIALAVAVLRLARGGTLVQELASVETLARADIIFVDKTGTITDGTTTVAGLDILAGDPDLLRSVLVTIAHGPADDPDLAAIRSGVTGRVLPVRARVPFSAERRWSQVSLADMGDWRLGAPEAVLSGREAMTRALARAAEGYRVLALRNGAGGSALVRLQETIRPDAAATFDYLARQGVQVKVLSGDSAETVAAVARRAGLTAEVVGRATPEQKRDIVHAARREGHVVAMVGDGVNDILALKEANVGVAMLSASPAARAVAQLVIARGGFASLPDVIAEGRRVIGNVERLASLFLTKTVYALALAFTAGILLDPFPFLPRHLTLVGLFTIGIPAFFLALERNEARPARGFVRRTLEFAVPAGLAAAAATYVAYELAPEDLSLDSARTTAALVLSGVALWILSILARPLTRRRWALLVAMVLGVVLTFLLPPTRVFFGLSTPPALVWLAGIGVVALTGVALELAAWASGLVARVLRGI